MFLLSLSRSLSLPPLVTYIYPQQINSKMHTHIMYVYVWIHTYIFTNTYIYIYMYIHISLSLSRPMLLVVASLYFAFLWLLPALDGSWQLLKSREFDAESCLGWKRGCRLRTFWDGGGIERGTIKVHEPLGSKSTNKIYCRTSGIQPSWSR